MYTRTDTYTSTRSRPRRCDKSTVPRHGYGWRGLEHEELKHFPAGEQTTPTQRLHTLSEAFFKEYTLAGPEDEIANADKDPTDALMVGLL